MPKKEEKTKKQKPTKVKESKKVTSDKSTKDVTEIVCIVDRSGSMGSIKDDAIGGFNNFLSEQQKEPGKALMTIILFNTNYDVLCSGKPVKECAPFNNTTYNPTGSTALLDATGRAINEVNQRNPKKAIIMILTDGHENSSHEFTKQQIKKMIADCEEKKWVVIYLSADANAFDDGKSVGIGMGNIMPFKSDERGAHVSTMAASFAASDYRQRGRIAPMMSYSARAGNLYDSQHHNHRSKTFH